MFFSVSGFGDREGLALGHRAADRKGSAVHFSDCEYVRIDIQYSPMDKSSKPLVWLHGEIKTPPFSSNARIEAGVSLRKLQLGENLGLPESRPMRIVGPRCHELRIIDENLTWRIMYRIEDDCIVVLDVFEKKTRTTLKHVIDVCRNRLRRYGEVTGKKR